MLQRLADIKTDATAAFEKESKELLVRLDADSITLALADKETGNWEAAEILKTEATDRQDETFLDNLRQSSSLINYKGLPVKVVVATPAVLAVPAALSSSISLFFEAQFGGQHTNVLSDKTNETIVFAHAPQAWQQQLVATLFTDAAIYNSLALLTRQSLQHTGEEGTCLYLHLGKTFAEIVLIQQGNLAIARSLEYSSSHDLLYHLLNIARQFGLSPASLSLQLQGQITEADSLLGLLRTYFSPVSFAPQIDRIRHKAFWTVPPHYFTGLMLPV